MTTSQFWAVVILGFLFLFLGESKPESVSPEF